VFLETSAEAAGDQKDLQIPKALCRLEPATPSLWSLTGKIREREIEVSQSVAAT
jgi:hypothetical protein